MDFKWDYQEQVVATMQERLTKMCKIIPTKMTVKTPELACLFIVHVYKLYGLPASIISDRDRKFDNHF